MLLTGVDDWIYIQCLYSVSIWFNIYIYIHLKKNYIYYIYGPMDLMGIWKQVNLIQFQGSSMVNWSMWSSVWNLGFFQASDVQIFHVAPENTFEHWTWTYVQLALHPKNELTTLSIWVFPKTGGTQQPWVFLLKMIILGCFGDTTI